jgi:peptidoglycan/xylan/chitin deacetylase (PgdA/CDA1 family)
MRPPIDATSDDQHTHSLPDSYLVYEQRKYGMDHDFYDWSILPRRKPVTWPNDARIALWVTPVLEFFPLNTPVKPFKAQGGMVTPYPDLRHFTLREYGNRVGLFRVLKIMDELGIKGTVPMNSDVAKRMPFLVEEVVRRNWEIIAHGVNMGKLHYSGLDEAEERAQVQESLSTLREISGQKVRGWLSPARSESYNTPDLVAAEGVDYLCDWINDDMPYPFRTKWGGVTAMPHQHWISDVQILFFYKQSGDEFVQQVKDQFDTLHREAGEQGGRIMAITIHPWMSGQPHRIKYLEKALEYVMGQSGVWTATGSEILDSWKGQQ